MTGSTRSTLGSRGLASLITTLALALGAMAGSPAIAAGGDDQHIVAVDGSGDFRSIQSAVDAATSGQTVVVRPGTYTEAVTVDKDLTLVGDGPRDEIVIAATADPSSPGSRGDVGRPYAVALSGDEVRLTDLSVWTPDGTNGVVVTAGAPVIERVSFAGPEEAGSRSSAHAHRLFTSLAFFGPATSTVRDSEWDGYVAVRDGASVDFVGNVVHGDTISINGPGDSSVRDSTLHRGSISFSLGVTGVAEGNEFFGDLGQVGVDTGSDVVVHGNSFTGSADDASIWVEGPDVSAVISGNTVSDSVSALRLARGGIVVVEGNTIDSSSMGITVNGTDAHIEDNIIRSDGAGIVIVSGAEPMLVGNSIEAGKRAVVVGPKSGASISGNVICGAEAGIYADESPRVQIGDNEICGSD